MIKYDKNINEKNIKDFKRNIFPNGTYKCVICGKDITLNDSFSNSGDKMACQCCIYEFFGDKINNHEYINFEKLHKWYEEKEK